MTGCTIELEALRVWREDPAAGEARLVIDGLSLEIAAGERVALVGENGAGKTSLLLALVGATPFDGHVRVDDVELGRRTLARVRREIGFVFAEPAEQLFSPTVREEVAFSPRQLGVAGDALATRVRTALEQVGLAGFEERAPGSLSLGEQRRLALATALAAEPKVLLLDEPTASLDGRARRAVLTAMKRTRATLLFATHDLGAALELTCRVVLIKDGRLVASGPAEELLRDAATLDRAGLDPPLGPFQEA